SRFAPPAGGSGMAQRTWKQGEGSGPATVHRRRHGRENGRGLSAVPEERGGMMAAVFRTTRRIDFSDTDMAGIVHFANFFRFMESAETEFLRSRGLSVKLEWEGQALGFPRVSASCDYLRPAFFEDLLEVTLRVDRIG